MTGYEAWFERLKVNGIRDSRMSGSERSAKWHKKILCTQLDIIYLHDVCNHGNGPAGKEKSPQIALMAVSITRGSCSLHTCVCVLSLHGWLA